MAELADWKERDLGLPREREGLLQKVMEDLLQDPNVLGVFLGGSLAKDNPDLYSDIDLRVVVAPEQLDRYIRAKKQRPSAWGNVLFYEDISPGAPFTIAHFDCFLKVDVFYYKPDDIQPSLWLQHMKIMKDWDGVLERVYEASGRLQYAPSLEEVEVWRGKVLAYIGEVYRRVRRKEWFYALTQINSLCWFIVNGWNMEADRMSGGGWDWSKLQGSRSPLESWQLELLEQWFAPSTAEEMIGVLNGITPEFLRLNQVLSARVGLAEEREMCEQVIGSVLGGK
ncbi:nucleotidyltransferase domain-containing protein [Paenibacillus gansuensis]|uniref:Nucleotidyltransferase domain-containing protein n=1 Tax=Paenibacillus gansuensis TaxID=306542 RepID=A0ABW5P938_9BACL